MPITNEAQPTNNSNNVCLEAFMKEINQELSVSCMLPHNLPKKELLRIINQAKKWFYKNYEYAVEEKYMYLESSLWSTEEFRQTAEVTLINDVVSVTSVWQIGKDSGEASLRMMFDEDNALRNLPAFSRLTGDPGGKLSLSTDNMMHYVIAEKFYDLTRMITVNKMSYQFNYLSHKFRVMGEPPTRALILQVYTKLDDCSLFDEEIFFRYSVAQAKVQLSRVLGTFNYNLPGNISVNYDLIRSEGQDELDRIKEEIKSEEGTDYFFIG
jgi:hypothetical protein